MSRNTDRVGIDRNAQPHNAPTGQTVIAQGNALGANVPPKPPSPNGGERTRESCCPLGQACIGALQTQGNALGYRRLCRWHIGQNDVTQIAMTQFTKIQSKTWQPNANQEEGWPQIIDDPPPPTPEIAPKRRLHDTIAGLNRNHVNRTLRFFGNGTSDGVRCKPIVNSGY